MPVVDTSFLVDLQLGLPEAEKALRHLGTAPLLLPYQAATEYLAGLEDEVAGLEGLKASFDVSAPTEAHVLEAARIARSLRRRPPWGDIHIAAVAQLEGTYVLTANAKDFEALGCRVWDYRKGGKPPA